MKQLLFYLLLLPALCFAQVPDPLPNTYVNDLANVLTPGQIQTLNERIRAIETKSSVQIAVILMQELPANMEIDQYTLEVGRKWHVGNARNGLVYAAAIKQRKQRLEVAGNLEGTIPDVAALHITDAIKPYFRKQDYFGGINKLLDGIDAQINPVKEEQMKLAAEELEKKGENSDAGLIIILFSVVCIGMVTAVIAISRYNRRKNEKEVDYSPLGLTGTGNIPGMIAGTIGIGAAMSTAKKRRKERPTYTPPVDYQTPPPSYTSRNDDNDSYKSSSNNDNSSSFGDWGSGSSGSDSNSGFSGGGSSNDW